MVLGGGCVVRRTSRWVVVVKLFYGDDALDALDYTLRSTGALAARDSVRAGSVIFLVGVGSLVCWKLWEHWRSGGDSPGCLRPSPPTSPPARRPRGLLASLLEEDLVQDPDDLDDEDPTLIHGKYFGPDSPCGEGPCDEVSLLSTDVSEASEAAAQHYLADASASVSVGDAAPSSSEESLPTDEDSDLELFGGKKRVVKRKHKASELGTPRHGSSTAAAPARTVAPSGGSARHRVENKYGQHSKASHMARHPLQEGWMSSESSPENGPSCLRDLTRLRGDGSETPDSEELVERRRLHMAHSLPGGDLDGSWFTNNRCQPEGEEYQHAAHISSASLSDLMEKMRYRGHRGGSMSRDNSITSNLSEQVTSPLAAKKFPFKREDSVCSNISNISDFALSECSEMSLDVSVHDDLACKTITCLDDIEHELDELKSSMLEMDEEVTKFSSRPNPYSFRTTFSDYSIGSNDSRPSSALDILNNYRSRANFRGLLATKSTASDSEPVDGGVGDGSHTSNQLLSGSEPEGSFEWDSPQHGWTSARAPPLTRLPELPSEDAESSRASVQDDTMPSLEWDNDCLHQYQEDHHTATLHDDPLQQVFHQSPQDRQKLLPDHSSLELDMEEELMTSAGPVTEACDLYSAPMTVSIDSAIHSATGSRSTSSSPLPSGMTNSLLRYAPGPSHHPVHAAQSPHPSHVYWEPRRVSTPRMSVSLPHPPASAHTYSTSHPANYTWPRTWKSRSGHSDGMMTASVVVAEHDGSDESPFDSALELSLSEKLNESFSELTSPQ